MSNIATILFFSVVLFCFDCTFSIWNFPGQWTNLSHCDLLCSCGNDKSLTHWAGDRSSSQRCCRDNARFLTHSTTVGTLSSTLPESQVQWVKDLALSLQWLGSLLWHGFNPWLRNFYVLQEEQEWFLAQSTQEILVIIIFHHLNVYIRDSNKISSTCLY